MNTDPEVEAMRAACRRLTDLSDVEALERRIAHRLRQLQTPTGAVGGTDG